MTSAFVAYDKSWNADSSPSVSSEIGSLSVGLLFGFGLDALVFQLLRRLQAGYPATAFPVKYPFEASAKLKHPLWMAILFLVAQIAVTLYMKQWLESYGLGTYAVAGMLMGQLVTLNSHLQIIFLALQNYVYL